MAEVTPGLLYFSADLVSKEGVAYRDEPFRLRAGGESHWYVDGKRGTCEGPTLALVGGLAVVKSRLVCQPYTRVCGMGIGGIAFAYGMVLSSERGGFMVTEANENEDPDQRYGYGLHGASIVDEDVLEVDDTASTGDSLCKLYDMIVDEGGRVSDAFVMTDRSNGLAATAMAERGVRLHSLFEFSEEIGMLVPTGLG